MRARTHQLCALHPAMKEDEADRVKEATAKQMARHYWPLLSDDSRRALMTMDPPQICERIITIERENQCMRRCLDVAAQQRRDAGSQPTRAQPPRAQPDEASSAQPAEPEVKRLRRDVGSQPTHLVVTAVHSDGSEERLGTAIRTYFYQEDDKTWQLMDDALNQKLRGDKTPSFWKGADRSGTARWYWVDPAKLTSMNFDTRRVRPMCCRYMFVVAPSWLADVEQTVSMDSLVLDGWEMRWQYKDTAGWKNMGLSANECLLHALCEGESEVELKLWRRNPKSRKWQPTMYDVNIETCVQKRREGTHNDRPVRLVALTGRGGWTDRPGEGSASSSAA